MTDQPEPQPSQPAKIPAPGSLPKLPQSAFNLEKRGSDSPGSQRRS